MNTRRRRTSVVPGACASFVLSALAALGASAAAPARADATADASAPSPYNLQEVVVTARRREEKLQDVPLAESVRTGTDLIEQNAVLLEDLAEGVPNVLAFTSARSVSALEITIRGQTALPSEIVYDPAVGLYVDGVYVAEGQGAMATLLDVDSVEIVRGTQGTLFGRNNTGGSISIHTHRPDLTDYSAEFALAGGNMGLFAARAILNIPLSSSFGLRFAYQDNSHEGWGSSIVTGQSNMMNQHRYEARAGALFEPNDSFSAYLTYERFYANEAGALAHPLAGTQASMVPGVIIPDDFYQTDAGKLVQDTATVDSWMLTLADHFSDAFAAKLILGYRDMTATNDFDADATILPIADVLLPNTSHQKSAELQLSGATPGKAFDWVGGLYYFRDSGSADSNLAPGLSSPFPTIDNNQVVNTSEAAYLHGEWHLGRGWSVSGGARYTDDGRSIADNAYQQLPPGPPGSPSEFCTILDANTGLPLGFETGGPCPAINQDAHFHYWSWEASTQYAFNPDLMTYFRAGRAQRSGGWNVPLNEYPATPFQPEQLTDFEIGIKANQLGGRLTLTADVFTGNYDNLQRLLAILINGTPTTIVINAGQARVSGFEFEGGWAATNSLRLQGSFGYTDAKYTTFIGPQGQDLASNQFYMTPKFDAALSAIYTKPVSLGKVLVRADYEWRDAVQFNVVNDFNNSPAVGLLNARVSLTSASGALEAAFFGTNLTDKRYAYIGGTIVNPGGPPVASWQAAADRTLYGVELTYRAQKKL